MVYRKKYLDQSDQLLDKQLMIDHMIIVQVWVITTQHLLHNDYPKRTKQHHEQIEQHNYVHELGQNVQVYEYIEFYVENHQENR